MNSKHLRKPERSPLDIISTLPEGISETILCLLPTKESARTSILSKEWRYKWTKIPKLEFHGYRKPFNIIHKTLLLHRGPIHEFTLDIWKEYRDTFGFNQIILHLSTNHLVKKLTLLGSFDPSSWYTFPISVFSWHHLTDLVIRSFDIDLPSVFNGFGSLRMLVLQNVGISTEALLHLLSKCPSLKSLSLLVADTHLGDRECTVVELFKCLPMVEDLTIWGDVLQWLVLDSGSQELPTSLFHLKYFHFEDMHFVDGCGLDFLFVLIKCSPNLEKIKLEIDWQPQVFEECPLVCDEYSEVWLDDLWQRHLDELNQDYYEAHSVAWEEYSDVWLEHLNEFEIKCFRSTNAEMEFVKFISDRSPKLKKVSITCAITCAGNQDTEMLKTLLEAQLSSPVIVTVS